MPEDDLLAAIVDQFGPPAGAVNATPKEIDRYRDRLPSALLDFWVQHGLGRWKDGRTWLCDPALLEPIVHAIFEGDAVLVPDDITTFAYIPRHSRHPPKAQKPISGRTTFQGTDQLLEPNRTLLWSEVKGSESLDVGLRKLPI